MSKLTDANWRESLKNIATKNSIISSNVEKDLPLPNSYSAIPAKQGKGTDSATKASGGGSGGGIASPLTEQSHTYYASKILYTSDGLFNIAFANYHEETYKDANDATVVIVRLDS